MRKQDKQPPKTKKYFRSTKSGAGMTKAGVARQTKPGSKLKQRSLAKSNQDQKLQIDVNHTVQEVQDK